MWHKNLLPWSHREEITWWVSTDNSDHTTQAYISIAFWEGFAKIEVSATYNFDKSFLAEQSVTKRILLSLIIERRVQFLHCMASGMLTGYSVTRPLLLECKTHILLEATTENYTTIEQCREASFSGATIVPVNCMVLYQLPDIWQILTQTNVYRWI